MKALAAALLLGAAQVHAQTQVQTQTQTQTQTQAQTQTQTRTQTPDEEVPFIATADQVTAAMLDLAQVRRGDHVIDLGSGDGRIVVAAALRGATGMGVELVPELVARSRAAAVAAGVAARTEFRQQDLFDTDLRPASVVTMYLLPQVNMQLRPRLLALAPGTRVVSHDWTLGDWSPDQSVVVDVPDKAVGREKVSRVHLWVVPAPVHGAWCSGASRLDIAQRFQRFSAVWRDAASAGQPAVFDGTIDGRVLTSTSAAHAVTLQADGGGLRLQPGAQLYTRCVR